MGYIKLSRKDLLLNAPIDKARLLVSIHKIRLNRIQLTLC